MNDGNKENGKCEKNEQKGKILNDNKINYTDV